MGLKVRSWAGQRHKEGSKPRYLAGTLVFKSLYICSCHLLCIQGGIICMRSLWYAIWRWAA